MYGLAPADWITLAAYLLLVTWIGLRAARKVHNTADYIMPRRFGIAMMIMHGFGTSTHSDQAVSVASKSFTSGLSGIWYQWMWLFATPFYWWIAPMMRRMRALTTGDVFEARFDRSVSVLYSLLGLAKFMVNIGLMLKGTAVIIDAVTAGQLSADVMILVMTVLFVVYGMAGGLGAAIVTDFMQGILTILFSFMLLPLALSAVGGMDGLRFSLAELRPETDMLSLVVPGDIGVFFIFMIAFNSLLSVAVQPHNMGTCAAGKTETEGAIGFMGGNLIKRVCTIAWVLTALAGVVYFHGRIEDPDLIYGYMAREFLPEVSPGLVGLFLAALLATVMGSCDSFMVSASGLATENLYRPLAPGKPDGHYLLFARFSGLIVVAGGVLLAYTYEGVVKMMEDLFKINTMMAMAFWLGIFWRRTSVAGAWAATLVALLTWGVTEVSWSVALLAEIQVLRDWGVVYQADDLWRTSLPWQMLFYIVFGFLAGYLVSLLTRPVDEEKLDRFYELLRTPIVPGEVVTTSCRLPAGVRAAPRRVLFPESQWEIPIPTWRAMAGFLVGWLCVFAIIGSVMAWIAD
jgi:Na+/proline symporter